VVGASQALWQIRLSHHIFCLDQIFWAKQEPPVNLGWCLVKAVMFSHLQAVGLIATGAWTVMPITTTGYFGYSFKAPANGTVNASQSGTLVISMGNGAAATNANSHNTFVIDIQGGTQDPTTYAWTNQCSVDQVLDNSTNNAYGLKTYRIALSGLTCSAGTLAALKADIKQISVKVVGGKEPTKDSSTTNNSTLMQVSYIGFAL
jgi:hypothetical protein